MYNDINENQEVKWRRWGRVVEMCDGKAVRKQKFIDRTGSVRECLDELIAESIPFAKHSFNARKQYQQYQLATDEETVIYHLNFAQNYTCGYQEAIQAVHWGKSTVTVHPIVSTYLCQNHKAPIRECTDIIPDDHKHDVHAVETFISKAREHLRAQGREFRREIQFFDGAAAQYKSKGAFADISYGRNVETGETLLWVPPRQWAV